MNLFDFQEKYNLTQNDVRTHFEKRVKFATMTAQMKERNAKAERSGNEKEKIQTEKHLKRLSAIAPSFGIRFEVPVRGTFDYKAVVRAADEDEASDVAQEQIKSLAKGLQIHVSKVGKPKKV